MCQDCVERFDRGEPPRPLSEFEDVVEGVLFDQRRRGIQLSPEGEEFMLARGIQKESLSR